MDCAVEIRPDDLAHVVDALRAGAPGSQGIVDRGVGAIAVKEAMRVVAVAVEINSDDLAQIIDAECLRAPGGQGIVEGDV